MSVDYGDPTFLEAVYAALFAQVSPVQFPAAAPFQKFQNSYRVVVAPDDVPPANQPCLVQVQGPMDGSQKQAFGPVKWLLTALLLVYFRGDGTAPLEQNPVNVTNANLIVWPIAQILEPSPNTGRQTLGDQVYHCWIEGQIHVNVEQEQVLIGIPVHILV